VKNHPRSDAAIVMASPSEGYLYIHIYWGSFAWEMVLEFRDEVLEEERILGKRDLLAWLEEMEAWWNLRRHY